MPRTGRPKGSGVIYGDDVKRQILERLAKGEMLRAICRDPGMPAADTVLDWAVKDPIFAPAYARARQAGYDLIAEEAIEISDSPHEDPNSRRVRVDTRKWILSKLHPQKYGDRIAQEITGANGGPVAVASVDLSALSREQLEKLKELAEAARKPGGAAAIAGGNEVIDG